MNNTKNKQATTNTTRQHTSLLNDLYAIAKASVVLHNALDSALPILESKASQQLKHRC